MFEVLGQILRAGMRVPSAGFSQGLVWLVLEGEDLERFWRCGADAAGVSTVETVPLVIVAFSCEGIYLDRCAWPDKGWTGRDEDRWPVLF